MAVNMQEILGKVQELKLENKEKDDVIAEQQRQLTEFEHRVGELEQKTQEFDGRTGELQDKCNDYESRLGELQNQVNDLMEQNRHLSEAKNMADELLNQLEAELA